MKDELGLDHYEGRGWRGFHHYGALCIAAYAFLVAERARLFSYPAETLQHLAAAPEPPVEAPPPAPADCADPTCWSYRYRVSHGRFAPLRVMDDGAHVYIQLSSREVPALFEVLPDRSTAPLNYRFSSDSRWIIVDRLFESARFVLRTHRRESTTTIKRIAHH